MIVSEKDAIKKYCPHFPSTIKSEKINTYVLLMMPEENANCIGSKCMAWRYVEVSDNRPRFLRNKKTGLRVSSGYSHETEWVLENPDEPMPDPAGYCGLAGNP